MAEKPPAHPLAAPGEVRLDKWLQVARAYKTRTQATHACTLGRVKVNGNVAKPHKTLSLDDQVEIDLGDWTRLLVVKVLRDKPVSKEIARTLFDDLSIPRATLDPMQRLMRRAPVIREPGAGRPTKRDRRDLERLRGE